MITNFSIAFSHLLIPKNAVGFEQTQLQIHIEPGLFEWGQWFVAHNEKFPAWIKSEELQSFGYRIEPSDRAIMSVDELNVHETLQDFYIRSEAVVQQILDKHKSEGQKNPIRI